MPRILAALSSTSSVVIEAPPGAGKTTRVPPALLDAPWLRGGKIYLIEPRRIAAVRAAEFIAGQLGESAGGTVGYRVRGATKVSAATRIEVMTEGVFLRILLESSELPGVGAVLFDEIHERSVLSDVALALSLEVQQVLRPELRLVAMSATLDSTAIAAAMAGQSESSSVARITSQGRAFPVETYYIPAERGVRPIEHLVRVVRQAFREREGDILCFLPGASEIYRAAELLKGDPLFTQVTIAPLLGEQPLSEQQSALQLDPQGRRKIILATAVAESSVTVPGVTVVVDSGLSRLPFFDRTREMTSLETIPVSAASAEQRRGRAGRVAPGFCYRCWDRGADEQQKPFHEPQIATSDLTPTALVLAQWGATSADGLRWISTPPRASIDHGFHTLLALGAIDQSRAITAHGKILATLPVHPRIGHLVLRGAELGAVDLACQIAAVLEEPRLTSGVERETDISELLSLLNSREPGRALERARENVRELRALVSRSEGEAAGHRGSAKLVDDVGVLIACAYPDRIAKRRDLPNNKTTAEYLLASGAGAMLPISSALARSEWLAIATMTSELPSARIRLAASLSRESVEQVFAAEISAEERVEWNPSRRAVVQVRERMLGALPMKRSVETARGPAAEQLFLSAIAGDADSFEALPWGGRTQLLLSRFRWAARVAPNRFDAAMVTPEELRAQSANWLAPYLPGITAVSQISEESLYQALTGYLGHELCRRLSSFAPEHFHAATGRQVAIDYQGPQAPSVEIKLQELFGTTKHPAVGDGAIPITFLLLSPAQRPVQITSDIPGFWERSYHEVRKELRIRYPKHSWPENPRAASATKR